VNGLKTEHILGSSTSKVDTDLSVSVMGISTEIAIKEKQCKFGTRKTTITNGDDELTMMKGDITETIMTFGNRKTTLIGPGDIQEIITTGDRSTTIITGDYEVTVAAGNVNVRTAAGTVKVSGTSVELLGTTGVEVKGPTVQLGFGPTGGVVTGTGGDNVPSHFDYVTGSPLKGAATVKAGL
jgi:hypothetical protein